MARGEAPRIDSRTYGDLVAELERRIESYTGPPAPPKGDAGWALVRICGRMAEQVVNRLNQLPDRGFLAFLDLIGTRVNPPQPARVPLTFLLAAGSPVDALVPAGTQAVAEAWEGEAEPPVFATERDLVVTRSELVAVYSRDPRTGLWADHTAVAAGRQTGSFHPFRGDQPIQQRLYVDHPLLGRTEDGTIVLRIGLKADSSGWPAGTVWSFWDGKTWETRTPAVSAAPGASLSVELKNVPGSIATRVNGLDGHWLRAVLETGGEGWSEPCVDSLSVRVTIDRTACAQRMLPERSFANDVPVDLSKDFLPFGEKPRVGDVFYLASEEAFSKPGAEVSLHVTLSDGVKPEPSSDLQLITEFWDGRKGEWQELPGVADGTDRLRQRGELRLTVPDNLAANEVHGELRHWIRVRIARGNYGVEAGYAPVLLADGQPKRDERGAKVYELSPATFQPPSLRSLRVGYFYDSGDRAPRRVLTENDFTFEDVTQQAAAGGAAFEPFQSTQDKEPTLYLGFERPGDVTGFSNRTTALFFEVPEASPGAERSAVVWEYWNGRRWEWLGTDDETRGLTNRGLLSFVGPPDFSASVEFGRAAFWLRGRWEGIAQAAGPRLGRVLTNTIWAAHAETVQGECLGSSRGEPGQAFRTLRAPVLDGPVLEVVEPEVPSGDELSELESEEGEDAVAVVRDAAGQVLEVRVRWHEVPDFYGSGPRSRHYVLDPLTGEVRFGDGLYGLVPPPGRDNVCMARYRTGGGLAGNRPAGSITQLKGTVPYIAGVVQLLPAQGGVAQESLEAVRARGPKALRHRGRATAADDFEDLAFQASPEVARAWALPAGRGSAVGQVGLILLPDADAVRPVPGPELLDRVRSYIEARLSPVVDLWVTGPDWLRIDIEAEVVPRRLDAALAV
ncbi:MAG TPA: putative baseplate assembly protein, partial [Thermoanaerobaculia bacterium]|nr:putative baseplate assembly protein [Thermoanaerobaculia bacterium]